MVGVGVGGGLLAGERQSFWLEITKIRRMRDCLTLLCFVRAHCAAEAANSVNLCSRGTKGGKWWRWWLGVGGGGFG